MDASNPEPMDEAAARGHARAVFDWMERKGQYYRECVDETTRSNLERELAKLLVHGYIKRAIYRCEQGVNYWSSSYSAFLAVPHSRLVRHGGPPGASGWKFSSNLEYSQRWYDLKQVERDAFQAEVGVSRDRSGGPEQTTSSSL